MRKADLGCDLGHPVAGDPVELFEKRVPRTGGVVFQAAYDCTVTIPGIPLFVTKGRSAAVHVGTAPVAHHGAETEGIPVFASWRSFPGARFLVDASCHIGR